MPLIRQIRRRRRPPGKVAAGRWQAALAACVLASMLVWWSPPIPTPRILERWPAPDAGFSAWEPLFQGIDRAMADYRTPRPMKCHAIRFDLTAPGLSFFVKPSNGERPLETDSQFTSSFLRQHGLQFAVSSSPFFPFVKWPGVPVDVVGLSVSEGGRYSDAVPNLDSLVITRDNRARFVRAGGDTSDAWNGAGGNLVILADGTDRGEDLASEAASAAGISSDGRYLYWLVVDGRQKGWSEGATPHDSARMLRDLGASSGLNFDGGSAVTMAKQGRWFGATVLNRPCHPYFTGFERPIGGILGVRAKPL